MYLKLEKYRCGGCGNDNYNIFKDIENEKIITVCTKCLSESEIVITKPKFDINWGEHGDGLMCL